MLTGKQGERRIHENESASRNAKMLSVSGGICCNGIHLYMIVPWHWASLGGEISH